MRAGLDTGLRGVYGNSTDCSDSPRPLKRVLPRRRILKHRRIGTTRTADLEQRGPGLEPDTSAFLAD